MFLDSIQEEWLEWLGGLAGLDPKRVLPDQRKSWKDTLTFITNTKIAGFGTGLTPLQFSNSLSLIGLVAEPTLEDMTTWLAKNTKLGAFGGLKLLGFNADLEANKDACKPAFECVYRFLDEHLSTSDKQLVHFGTIFVEHLLCKVSRWSKHGANLKEGGVWQWESGANEVDCMAFPIPVLCDDVPKYIGVPLAG